MVEAPCIFLPRRAPEALFESHIACEILQQNRIIKLIAKNSINRVINHFQQDFSFCPPFVGGTKNSINRVNAESRWALLGNTLILPKGPTLTTEKGRVYVARKKFKSWIEISNRNCASSN
jgi:hypothetical protein